MRNAIFILLFLSLGNLMLTAQSQTRFYVETRFPGSDGQKEPPVVRVGEAIRVSFVLKNGKGNAKFTPPDWEAAGFMALGSSQSSNISIMNGETTSSASYDFTITPIQEGSLSIPAGSIKNGDSDLKTEPVPIQALPNPDGVKPNPAKGSPAHPQTEPKRTFKTISM